jgi:hypothetical protein
MRAACVIVFISFGAFPFFLGCIAPLLKTDGIYLREFGVGMMLISSIALSNLKSAFILLKRRRRKRAIKKSKKKLA